MEAKAVFIGIDVSVATLDVAVSHMGETWRVDRAPAGMTALAERLQCLQPAAVVLEATGGGLPRRRVGAGRVARGCGQPSPGAGFCPGHGEAGQDRCPGCPSSGALCGSRPATGPPFA